MVTGRLMILILEREGAAVMRRVDEYQPEHGADR
jgi:hypothetical protein